MFVSWDSSGAAVLNRGLVASVGVWSIWISLGLSSADKEKKNSKQTKA